MRTDRTCLWQPRRLSGDGRTAFDASAPLDQRRAIIRRELDHVEMVELPRGLQPREPGSRLPLVIRLKAGLSPASPPRAGVGVPPQ